MKGPLMGGWTSAPRLRHVDVRGLPYNQIPPGNTEKQRTSGDYRHLLYRSGAMGRQSPTPFVRNRQTRKFTCNYHPNQFHK